MYRFKQFISSNLSLRNYNAQVGEALADVKAMKKKGAWYASQAAGELSRISRLGKDFPIFI